MYPWLRFVKVLATPRGSRPLDALGTSVVRFRVWPTDLDQNLHLNNGRYLMLMDLGRYDLVARTGLLRIAFAKKWYPVVHSATIRYRKPLDAWQSYELKTRIVGWDERAFFLEQRFVREGVEHAVGIVRGVFLGPEGRVKPADIARELGADATSPPVPAGILAWQRALEEPSVAKPP